MQNVTPNISVCLVKQSPIKPWEARMQCSIITVMHSQLFCAWLFVYLFPIAEEGGSGMDQFYANSSTWVCVCKQAMILDTI